MKVSRPFKLLRELYVPLGAQCDKCRRPFPMVLPYPMANVLMAAKVNCYDCGTYWDSIFDSGENHLIVALEWRGDGFDEYV